MLSIKGVIIAYIIFYSLAVIQEMF
jgi:hypothetical protein